MRSEMDGRELLEQDELSTGDGADTSRREFLRQLAVAGAGVAGLTMLSQEAASAALLTETILGTYTINTNFLLTTMRIESQSSSSFVGRFADGTRIAGTVSGARPGTVAITFNRLFGDGTVQIFFGAVAIRQGVPTSDVLLTGTYYFNGAGPLAWVATGSTRG